MFLGAKVSLATILKLAATGSIYVNHEPRTKRYGRAEIQLNAIVQYGIEIGRFEETSIDRQGGRNESGKVVVWLEPLNRGEFGFYCMFKIFEDEYGPFESELFCFYDGFDGPGMKTERVARNWMKEHFPEYREVKNENKSGT